MPRRLALSLLFVAAAAPVTAEIYRWTDANGSIHFSDTPPRQLRHSSVSVKPPVTVPMGGFPVRPICPFNRPGI